MAPQRKIYQRGNSKAPACVPPRRLGRYWILGGRVPAQPAPNQDTSGANVIVAAAVVVRLLGTLRTRAARVELAITTLENDVEGPRVAEVAVPHNQRAVRFNNLEGVRAVALDSHRERKGLV